MRSSTHRPARRWAAALLIATLLAGLPGTARASEDRPGPGEIRRRIEALDAEIARVQTALGIRSAPSNRATWLLFKAQRALDLARLDLRAERLWGIAPDVLRLSVLGPSREELVVAVARARYRTLSSSRRVGGTVRLVEALRARLTRLELDHAQLVEALSTVDGPATSGWGGGTPDAGEWAGAFLEEIGAPACQENRVLVVAWQAQEGTEARFNPLATTHWMPGATDFNSVGVKNYRSVAQGLAAARETLEDGSPSYGYEAILSSLRACDDAEATAWFVNASAWCRGCTGGAYLTGLLPAVRADYATYAAR
jgi:hypothetical protein